MYSSKDLPEEMWIASGKGCIHLKKLFLNSVFRITIRKHQLEITAIYPKKQLLQLHSTRMARIKDTDNKGW